LSLEEELIRFLKEQIEIENKIVEYIHPSRNVLANSLYMMGIDLGQGVAPLITAGLAVQYGLEYTFIVSAVISAATAILIFLLISKPLRKL